MIVDVTDADVLLATAFLERHPETSLLLLSTFRAFGTRLGDSLYSGNVKAIVEGGEIQAVWCLTRSGNLVAQAAGRADFAPAIVEACAEEPIAIRGVLGEWSVSEAIWTLACAAYGLTSTFVSKEASYRLELDPHLAAAPGDGQVRMLTGADYPQWDRLSLAFLDEQHLPAQGTPEQRQAAFMRSSGLGHWWGAFDEGRLRSLAGYVALYRSIAQIGGVFTPPEWRRAGLSRAVMTRVMRDSTVVHGLERLFLFTGEANVAARRLYESLGFEPFGHYGLFFGG